MLELFVPCIARELLRQIVPKSVPSVDKATEKAQQENKYERFQTVSIGSGIGGNIAGSRKDVCHDTFYSDTQCVMAHFGERGGLF